MAAPSVIHYRCTELIRFDIYDRLTGRPVSTGTFTCFLKDKHGNVVENSTFTLLHMNDKPGTWRGVLSGAVTSTLQVGERYTFVLEGSTPIGNFYSETPVEVVIQRLE
ncbi:MAG: hypothetical protein QW303_01670 [Nitrososphaerota archaeon]